MVLTRRWRRVFLLKEKPPASAGVCVLRHRPRYTTTTPVKEKGGDCMANSRLYKLDHCTYTCQYHIVWIPRYRGRVLADRYIKLELKRIIKTICRWKGFIPLSWHIGDEHIHLYVVIPPKHSVAYAIGILKGKTSAWIKKKTTRFPSGPLWARGYFVSTVGIDEMVIRRYIERQQGSLPPAPQLPF